MPVWTLADRVNRLAPSPPLKAFHWVLQNPAGAEPHPHWNLLWFLGSPGACVAHHLPANPVGTSREKFLMVDICPAFGDLRQTGHSGLFHTCDVLETGPKETQIYAVSSEELTSLYHQLGLPTAPSATATSEPSILRSQRLPWASLGTTPLSAQPSTNHAL